MKFKDVEIGEVFTRPSGYCYEKLSNDLPPILNARFVHINRECKRSFYPTDDVLMVEKQMSKLAITEERLRSAANKCPQAKEVLKELFPEVFDDSVNQPKLSKLDWKNSDCDRPIGEYIITKYLVSTKDSCHTEAGFDRGTVPFYVDFQQNGFVFCETNKQEWIVEKHINGIIVKPKRIP